MSEFQVLLTSKAENGSFKDRKWITTVVFGGTDNIPGLLAQANDRWPGMHPVSIKEVIRVWENPETWEVLESEKYLGNAYQKQKVQDHEKHGI